MNSVLENSYAWTGSFVDAINRLSCDVASLIFSSLSLTPDPPSAASSSSNSGAGDSGSASGIPSTPVVSGEKAQPLNFTHLLEEALGLFAFDDFQYLLLKIFLAIILSNVCLIYIAWYVYGDRISERFMTPNTSPEELNEKVLQLKLPREHSQRHS